MVNNISAYVPTLAPVEQGQNREIEIYLRRGIANTVREGVYLAMCQFSLYYHDAMYGKFDVRSLNYEKDSREVTQMLRKIHNALLTVQVFNFASCQVSKALGFNRYLRLPEAFVVLAQEYALRYHEQDGIVRIMLCDVYTAGAIRLIPLQEP